MTARQSDPSRSRDGGAREVRAVAVEARRAAPMPLRIGARLMNPIIRRLAGKRHVRLFALIAHQGRRSGRTYMTPVAARRTVDGFVIPMAFGEQADWFRNVQAAGECVIRWNGIAYHVVEPVIVNWATVRPAFRRVERLLAPLFAQRFVLLRRAPSPARDEA